MAEISGGLTGFVQVKWVEIGLECGPAGNGRGNDLSSQSEVKQEGGSGGSGASGGSGGGSCSRIALADKPSFFHM